MKRLPIASLVLFAAASWGLTNVARAAGGKGPESVERKCMAYRLESGKALGVTMQELAQRITDGNSDPISGASRVQALTWPIRVSDVANIEGCAIVISRKYKYPSDENFVYTLSFYDKRLCVYQHNDHMGDDAHFFACLKQQN